MPDGRFHSYEPRNGHGLRNEPLNSIVGPRPIGWIASRSAAGVRNLSPYSFFNAFNYRPPLIGFASIGWKDTVSNVSETRDFVWNLVSRPLAERMNASSVEAGPDEDEFDLAGLQSVDSTLVGSPRVADALVSFECRLSDLHRLRDAAGGELDTWLVLGEVVMIHIDRSLIEDGRYQVVRARHVLRGGGGAEYFEVGDGRFEMRRPTS